VISAIAHEPLVRVGDDLLHEVEGGVVRPDADECAVLAANGRGEHEAVAVLAVDLGDDRSDGGLLDDRAREPVRPGHELALEGFRQPGLGREGAAVDPTGIECPALGVGAVDRENLACGRDQHAELVDAVGGHIVVHDPDERVAGCRPPPIGGHVRGDVEAERLHVAVALEQVAVDEVVEGDGVLGQALHEQAADAPSLVDEGGADHRGGQQTEREEETDQLRAKTGMLQPRNEAGGAREVADGKRREHDAVRCRGNCAILARGPCRPFEESLQDAACQLTKMEKTSKSRFGSCISRI
jgi:hypothetical protein